MTDTDYHFLQYALRIAARGMGRTWPNPSVGCVLVRDGQILATARTADTGRPHAETQALASAGAHARGATAYVTLEPCAHHGKTPPCAQALIDAGVARVVYACHDPDPRVAGQGAAMLCAAGIEVDYLPLPEATQLNRGFFRRIHHGLPHVAMKLATSLDGKITDEAGNSQWITGEVARAHGNQLRSQFDCLITGIGTVLTDNPRLDIRPPNLPNPQFVRVICDRQLRLPLTSHLARAANTAPIWLVTHAQAIEESASHATDLREAGVTLIVLEDAQLAPVAILRALAAEGITRALIEAGRTLNTAFLAAQHVQTLHWYRAPILLGNAGQPAIDRLDSLLSTTNRHTTLSSRMLGEDRYEHIELTECLQD